MPASPEADHRAVVGRVDDDRVVGEALLVDEIEQRADQRIVLDHAVGIEAVSGLAEVGLHVREVVHARCVEPHEEGLFAALARLRKSCVFASTSFVDRFHTLLGERSGVLDFLRRWWTG